MTAEEFKKTTFEALVMRIATTCEALESTLNNQQKTKEIPAWCTLTQAAELKGGPTAQNLRKRKWQQPCCGTNYQILNGTRVWSREQIIRWLNVTDDTLESYATECGVDISAFFVNGRTVTKEI